MIEHIKFFHEYVVLNFQLEILETKQLDLGYAWFDTN